MQSEQFRVTTGLDERLTENIDVLATMFPEIGSNKAELTRKAFELAAQYLINCELEKLGGSASDSTDDHEMMMAQFPGDEK